jgi:urease accessory protein
MFQWLSPSFPTGSFNFSQGLEYAVSQSMVKNEIDLVEWIENNLEHGFLRNDAIFLKLAYHISKDEDLDDLTEKCLAFSCSALKLNEQVLTGDNFAKASDTQLGLPYPIALGAAAKKHKFKIEELIPLFLQSNISNLLAAAQRLLPLGHKRSTGILKNLFEKINKISRKVLVSSESDLFSSCYLADTCTLLHEELEGKIFKS